LRESIHDLNTKVESKNQFNNLPIETISATLTQIAKEVRSGVTESRQMNSELEQRILELESEKYNNLKRQQMQQRQHQQQQNQQQNMYGDEQLFPPSPTRTQQHYPPSNAGTSPRHSVVHTQQDEQSVGNGSNANNNNNSEVQSIQQLRGGVQPNTNTLKHQDSMGSQQGSRVSRGGPMDDKSKMSLLQTQQKLSRRSTHHNTTMK